MKRLLLCFLLINCTLFLVAQTPTSMPVDQADTEEAIAKFDNESITVGAERLNNYLSALDGKRVALVVNQTSMVGDEHLVDKLLESGVKLVKIFAPEHGFRGTADAGETVKNSVDVKTNLPIVSLYGKNKKPTAEQLSNVDVVVFDIQDVGARFYTYISTMHYVMEACAENKRKLLILDRPNPNGHYVDGPILDAKQKSFVGMHPIPIVHGLTVGELACMIEGENWLKNELSCDFEVIECKGYTHKSFYQLPVKPSPNLPDMKSVYLYPHLCLFEGTPISIGRGTETPFQWIGHPSFFYGKYAFTPQSNEGSKYPKHEGKECRGFDLKMLSIPELQGLTELNFNWLYAFHRFFAFQKEEGKDLGAFFNENLFFDKLAGSGQLRNDLIAGKTPPELRMAWEADVRAYKKMRKKYLLYPDFE